MCFVAPEQKLFYGQFLLPDSVKHVLETGLISLNFHALVLFTLCFVAPEQMLFYGQFLLPDSVERVFKPGA